MRVEVHPDSSGEPRVHLRLQTAGGEDLRSDILGAKARFSEVGEEDFKVTWATSSRVEVSAWKSPLRACVWQLEDGTWMDRRNWEDRRSP